MAVSLLLPKFVPAEADEWRERERERNRGAEMYISDDNRTMMMKGGEEEEEAETNRKK